MTAATATTRKPYFLLYMRHIDGIRQRLTEELAPKYVDVIQHNKMRTVDRIKARRLQSLKVYAIACCDVSSLLVLVYHAKHLRLKCNETSCGCHQLGTCSG